MKKSSWLFMCAVMLISVTSFAGQVVSTKDVVALLGKSVSEAKAAIPTTAVAGAFEPSASHKGNTELYIRTKGIRIFYGENGLAKTIRLEPPFAGDIGGVHIGDSLQKLKSTLGQPIRPPSAFGEYMSYFYNPDDNYSARFDVNSTGNVGVVFLFK